MKYLLPLNLSLITVLFLSGCSSKSSPSPSYTPIYTPPTETNTTITPPLNPVAGIDYTDPTQFMQTTNILQQLSQINAQVAHNNGFTGGNISLTTNYTTVSSDVSNRNLQTIVAVLDSGVNANHEDLDNGKIIGWKDFNNESTTPYDHLGHGTMVSSIISGERQNQDDYYYGIAYGSKILSGQIMTYTNLNDPNTYTTNNIILKNAIDWVSSQSTVLNSTTQKLTTLNLSLGTTDPNFIDTNFKNSLLNVLNKDISIVIASGNEGLDCLSATNGNCAFPAAAPWVNSTDTSSYLNNNGGWVVVGSVDSNNNISYFSNKAGITKSNYIVAPGENLIGSSNSINDGYNIGSGTSFAAPLVSGALALMEQKWPHLNGKQHAQILFDTATDLGITGIDDIYGNGLLNLEKAFNPVGIITIPPANINIKNYNPNNGFNLNATKLTTSSSLISLKSLEPLKNTMILDSYNRNFNIDMTSTIQNTGFSSNNFENYYTLKYKNLLFGFNIYNNLPMLGLQINEDLNFKLSYDDQTLLGMKGEGALNTGNNNTTYLNIEKNIYNNNNILLKINGNYAYGQTNSENTSLITNISNVHALGGNLKLSFNGLGIGYEIPLRTVKGTMDFNLPNNIDNNGNIIYTKYSSNLKPDNFEQTFSIFYNKQLNNYNLFAQLNHTKDAFGYSNIINNEFKFLFNYNY